MVAAAHSRCPRLCLLDDNLSAVQGTARACVCRDVGTKRASALRCHSFSSCKMLLLSDSSRSVSLSLSPRGATLSCRSRGQCMRISPLFVASLAQQQCVGVREEHSSRRVFKEYQVTLAAGRRLLRRVLTLEPLLSPPSRTAGNERFGGVLRALDERLVNKGFQAPCSVRTHHRRMFPQAVAVTDAE